MSPKCMHQSLIRCIGKRPNSLKMKLIILITVALAAVAVAAPPTGTYAEPPKIIRSDFQHNPDGGYAFGYETEDGSARAETGEVKQAVDADNKPHDVVVVRGSYSYIDSEGKEQKVTYSADENGYFADGDIIPKPASRR